MGPPQDHDAHVDAIDLTLSSPEPEARPQPQTYAYSREQLQPTTRVKQESGSMLRDVHRDNGYLQQQSSTSVPQQQPRINPQHVKQIIDTSSPRALRHIVLQLCKTSPALSGALVRGLAPHSAYAQGLIRQQARAQAQRASAIKTEQNSARNDGYEQMKKRYGPGGSVPNSISRPPSHRPSAAAGSSDGLRVPNSYATARMNHETRPSPVDSDDSTNIVDFPEIERDSFIYEPRKQPPTSDGYRYASATHHSAERLAVRQRFTQHLSPDVKPRLCTQCGETFVDSQPSCYYHVGYEQVAATDDIPKYTCCGRFSGEPGCKVGQHISAATGTMTNTKRPSPSPYNGVQWLKKSRAL